MHMGMTHEYLVHGNLAMARGSVLRIEDGCDLMVYVWEGEVWLTQERERRDQYLERGDWFRLDRNGLSVLQSLSRSVITITSPSPELYARRIALVRAGTEVPVEIYSSPKAPASIGERLRRWWAGLYAPSARPTTAAL